MVACVVDCRLNVVIEIFGRGRRIWVKIKTTNGRRVWILEIIHNNWLVKITLEKGATLIMMTKSIGTS